MKLSNVTKQPRKKRKAQYGAALHVRKRTMSVHLSKELRASLKKRSTLIRKGDKVKVMVGQYKGASGMVSNVDYSLSTVTVEGVLTKLQSGKEKLVAIQPSNLILLERAQKKG